MTSRGFAAFVATIAACASSAGWIASAHAQAACPPACAGQTLSTPNFSHQDLTNADFTGATLVAPAFVRAKLTGAKFINTTFKGVPGAPAQQSDFTFADLTNASFAGAKFEAPTQIAYATLTCTDFSGIDLTTGNVVLGDGPLNYQVSQTCRTKFAGATMNCRFIDDWRAFDLTGAIVTACRSQLAGRNFANAVLASVNLSNMVLDGTIFAGANLTLADLDNASLQCQTTGNDTLQCVDLTGASMQGAQLNSANLTGATLYGAFLSNNVNGTISQAASLQQAHLKNVNLAFAQLSGVDFTLANFYGSNPANPAGCKTTLANAAGFTQGCASAHKATLTGTQFINAYLYGVDFTDASISGVSFFQAVVSGANFAGASIGTNPSSGAVTSFSRAFLHGTNLDQATLSQATLANAFVDFRGGGNIIYINLSGADHNTFACSTPSTCVPASGQDVCVWVRYPLTTVPASNTTITCPDGKPAGASGCGAADPEGGNARWNSNLAIGTPPNPGPPPAWYTNDATYDQKAVGSVICAGKGPTARVPNW